MSRPSAIARSLLVRAAGQALLPETPDEVEPMLVEAVLDTMCEMLGVDGEPDRRSASD
jgi:hypothetical protein